MGTPFIGEIRMFAGNFEPVGWMFCNGQLLPIADYDVLFNLIGTTYGGDGQFTFALPDLRGRIPVHQGQGAGLSNYVIGEMIGVESVVLTTNQIPAHTHPILGTSDDANRRNPKGSLFAVPSEPAYGSVPGAVMSSATSSVAGGSQPHSNLQPFLCVNFIISLYGIYPSPS